MTVNKVGRPSKAPERIAEILRATAVVVAREGLASTTLSMVAAEAGLQRTLVLHYFGTRDGLLRAFVDEAVAAYGTGMLRADSDLPVSRRIEAMFAPGAYRSRDDLVVWNELVALAARDHQVRDRLRELWTGRWLPDLEQQLADEYPTAHREAIGAAAYGLACLFEAHWAFHLQDVTGPDREAHGRRVARAILAGLSGPI
ncbi:TetR/AcrR family transcriptional regulator [Mycolicibacterium wolinskyi]|uniref:TetR/AcrR family transcriptional regulator n=1 Tax=Mycolicibacterium wolinskyi TaxID=59750 RepID=UPI003917B2D7